MSHKLHINRLTLAAMIAHARRAFPEECCGVLIGRAADGTVEVERAVPAKNIARGSRRKGYQIDWTTLLTVSRQSRQDGLRIVGFYHSHPSGSSVPSVRDINHAWPEVSYLILPMHAGRCTAHTSWRRCNGEGCLVEEELVT